MLEVAGQIGDGVLLSAGLSLAQTRRCLDHAAAGARSKGRDASAVRRVGLIFLYVSDDGQVAKTMLLQKLAHTCFAAVATPKTSDPSGLGYRSRRHHRRARKARDFGKSGVKLLPEKAASVIAGIAGGTPSQCRRDRLQEYFCDRA